MSQSAVLFDFDGTLTEPYLDFDVIRAEIGIQSGPILEAMGKMEEAPRRRAEQIIRRYEWEAARNATLQEGAVEVVASCRAKGMPTAIVTRNARETLDLVLTRYGLVVDAVRTREDGPIKPSPEPVLSLCEELSTDPRRSWVVGDYLFDITSGQAAGAQTVLMMGRGTEPAFADQADHIIRRLWELLPILGIS